MSEPQGDPARRRGPSPATALAALVLAVCIGAGGVLSVAGWILELEPSPEPGRVTLATGEAVSASSTDVATDEGFRVWARDEAGQPVRWDPCSPLELVVAPDGAPPGFLDDLETAVQRVRAATGLDIVVTGTTDERPSSDRSPYQPDRYGDRWAPVLVAWSSPSAHGPGLRDIDRAVATPVAVGVDGDRTYVSGQIVFNRDRTDLVDGFEDRASSWGSTIVHELGHLVGLDHVEDADELMAVHPGEGPVRFGPGDRAGLQAVGADHGCRDVIDPQPVEVMRVDG